MFVGLSAHSFATIANFQWFSKLPSPLNGMVEGNHWDQWFSDGFGVRQPLVTMVFDGCAPLVRRWNGYVPSSKSIDRSQSDFYFVPQEIQTDTATPLSMEIFGRIDFSLGRLITRVTKTPKPTKQHVTWAVELVRIFFHSLLWPWEPLS